MECGFVVGEGAVADADLRSAAVIHASRYTAPHTMASSSPVTLFVYDLSQGMARMLSPMLAGRLIEGIWHTSVRALRIQKGRLADCVRRAFSRMLNQFISFAMANSPKLFRALIAILRPTTSSKFRCRTTNDTFRQKVVVYGTEFFFGQGIMSCPPGQSMHGTPIEKFDMGQTHLPKEVVWEFMENLREIWTADKYHLLDNNCNSFTNEVCNFLVGKSIPAHITGLPAEFLETPLGQQLRPMIEAMFGPSQHGGPSAAPSLAPSRTPLSIDTTSAPAANTGVELDARSLAQLDSAVRSHRAVVAFFTRDGCGPCRMIEPELRNLVAEINSSYVQAGRRRTSTPKNFLYSVRIDTGVAFDAASHHKVTATPTFILFHRGEVFYRFMGANVGELRMSLYNLVSNSYPPHRHGKLDVPALRSLGTSPHAYPPVGEMDKLMAKLKQFAVTETQKVSSADWEANAPGLQTCAVKQDASLPSTWQSFLSSILSLDSDRVFPGLDLIRLLSSRAEIRTWLGTAPEFMLRARALGIDQMTPKAARLTLLKLACSLPANVIFTNNRSIEVDGTPTPYRTIATAILVESLLHPDPPVRQAAAGLAWNAALAEAATRDGSDVPASLAMDLEGESEETREEWILELVSAASTALERETESDEVKLRLLGALAHLVRFQGEAASELVRVLSVCDQVGAGLAALTVDGDSKGAEKKKKIAVLVKELETLTKE